MKPFGLSLSGFIGDKCVDKARRVLGLRGIYRSYDYTGVRSAARVRGVYRHRDMFGL